MSFPSKVFDDVTTWGFYYARVLNKRPSAFFSKSFVQFKKREKRPWRSVTFSKVASENLQLY